MYLRDAIVRLARQLEGLPYRWAGNGPEAFDCSGFICFVLRPFGLLPERGDWTAEGLGRMFEKTLVPEPGDLVLYGKGRPSHVMLFVGGKACLGATGGGPGTLTLADALRQGAFVREEPVGYRKDFMGYRSITKPVGSPERHEVEALWRRPSRQPKSRA